jgi:hypothetical protein
MLLSTSLTRDCYLRSTIVDYGSIPKSIRFDICYEYQVLVELIWTYGNCSSIRIFDTRVPGKITFEQHYEYSESGDLVHRMDKNSLRNFIRDPLNSKPVGLLEDLTNLHVILSFDDVDGTLQIQCIKQDKFKYTYKTNHKTTEMDIYALKCFV